MKLSKFISSALVCSGAIVRFFGNACLGTLRVALWPRRRPARAARVCVYRIGAIGDIVCATPALWAIRRAYPDAHLTLLTTPGKYSRSRHAEELLAGSRWLDEVICYDLEEIRTRRTRLALAARLREYKFDAWFDLTLDRANFVRMIRDMIMARLLGVRWAFGWRLEHVGFAAKAEAQIKEFPDEVERLAYMLRACGIADATSFPSFTDGLRGDSVQRSIVELGLIGRPLVAIAPGARRPCNLWPLERFATVIAELASRGSAIVLIGGADDREICAQIASRADLATVNLAGKMSLTDACALLRRCDLLICVDSGPQHLAAAAGTPCVSVFSQRNPRRRWYPHGSQHVVLEGSVECHTCLLDVCPYDNRCMRQITVERVLDAANSCLIKNHDNTAHLASAAQTNLQAN